MSDRSGSGNAGLVGFLLALALVAVVGAAAIGLGLLPPQAGGPGVGAATATPAIAQTSEPGSPPPDSPTPAATLTPPPTGAPPATVGPSPGGTHTVQPGESLFVIAEMYGVSIQAIVDANQIANPNLIQAGQVLIIPIPVPATAGAESYIVQPGDSITSIALALDVDPTDLADFNNLADWNSIRAGDVLYIPGPGWTPRPVEE